MTLTTTLVLQNVEFGREKALALSFWKGESFGSLSLEVEDD